jgi:transcriptional regulator with XRE-family HTH domain
MTNMKFGECLSLLLSALDISMNQLSKAINVDSSLVSRWVSGKRIPAYNTIYIDSITEYFSRNIKNSFQEQNLNKVLLSLNKNEELDGNIKEKMKKVLLESQGYSMECKKREYLKKKNQLASKDQVFNFVSMDQICPEKQNSINNSNQTIDLSNEDKIIFGIENIISKGISLLEYAINQQYKKNKIIYITYNNVNTTKSHYKLILLRNALLNAINNGWEVFFLLRLDNNINRIIRFINFIHPIMITGRIRLYYLDKYGTCIASKETYIVSDIGALSCFPTEPYSEITCSFYLKNKAGVNILKNYFNAIIANDAKPLIKYHTKNIEYHHKLTELEESIGNRFQYKYCFTTFTLTENLLEKVLRKKNLPNDEILMLLDFHKRQFNAFLSSIKYYQYKDIFLANSIEDLVMHKRFYFDYYEETEIINMDVEDIIELLQNIIYLLKTYDNYNIAFMPKNNDNFLKSVNSYCAIKERQAVLFETFNPLKDLKKVQLSIEENTLIKAFEEYFKQTWEQIAPINKDKNEIIIMLQDQIDILKRTYLSISKF